MQHGPRGSTLACQHMAVRSLPLPPLSVGAGTAAAMGCAASMAVIAAQAVVTTSAKATAAALSGCLHMCAGVLSHTVMATLRQRMLGGGHQRGWAARAPNTHTATVCASAQLVLA